MDEFRVDEVELDKLSQHYAEGRYFEGDLAISKKLILENYGGKKQAAVSVKVRSLCLRLHSCVLHTALSL